MCVAFVFFLSVVAAQRVLIVDARSYGAAIANRGRGGGYEHPEYYPNCDIQYMSLANIHTISKSFQNLRQLCYSSSQDPVRYRILSTS
jgi:myotubularin-related protein 3/4